MVLGADETICITAPTTEFNDYGNNGALLL